ncbi:hypothetical protein NEIMUCOT_06408 [Neisseria mucosa ATCC 25996]|uniref:Uncharacterized protein n=1 Tax=Neisseria mucosa (strain ATCC 25996 / DSM 4631 / NCTC 10774 / M26) TaxID=546266 RepID=D3A0H2_NEIM2|nr:hypothetical protein NEIMUCOT_06408 [Neisseria mucosa ATCC 25996]
MRYLFPYQCFNTQPPEGGWAEKSGFIHESAVSTHSRPKAAGSHEHNRTGHIAVSTHSRPKAAGVCFLPHPLPRGVSTHSRPKAAGKIGAGQHTYCDVSTHSRPKAAGSYPFCLKACSDGFQHTAARRRLGLYDYDPMGRLKVSTHSRPKAAGKRALDMSKYIMVSTHSRPKAAGN